MNILNGTSPTLVFLLVDQDDLQTGKTGLSPTVQISINGGPFVSTDARPVEIGAGWYALKLSAQETQVDGPIILQANADGTALWRDVHEVVPYVVSLTPGGGPTVSPQGPELARNGSFVQGQADWSLFSNGVARWSVTSGEAKIEIVQPGSNTQLYQHRITVEPGMHRLQFEARGRAGRQVDIALHQHDPRWLSLGLQERVTLSTEWTPFNLTFQVPRADPNARLRFWFFLNLAAGDTYWIRNVSLRKLVGQSEPIPEPAAVPELPVEPELPTESELPPDPEPPVDAEAGA